MSDKVARKYDAPNWKVGDTVFYKWDSGFYWQERVIVDETPLSWLVISPGYSDYQIDKTHWNYPKYLTKLPKRGYKKDQYEHVDHWKAGTKHDQQLTAWAMKNREAISTALRWEAQTLDAYRLLNLAKNLGLTAIVEQYPKGYPKE